MKPNTFSGCPPDGGWPEKGSVKPPSYSPKRGKDSGTGALGIMKGKAKRKFS